jgi:uncharacterized protein (DUF58 family)
LSRRLPSALAVAVPSRLGLTLENRGSRAWTCRVHDGVDSSLSTDGLPLSVSMPAESGVELEYGVIPTRRGEVQFEAADIRVRSRLGLCELAVQLGPRESRRVYPDFAPVIRYAWLAGNRRLQEIGVKSYQQRGQGIDFKQLANYTTGDSIRYIDWRATLRLEQPIVRQFQEDRDQTVLLMVDCGRRMRAHDHVVGGGHFDHVLNAVVLLTYVALKQGDAVGVMTCGAGGRERWCGPKKGAHALHAMIGKLYDLQPTLGHTDYVAAAEALLGRYPRRALVVVITNFRDEDGSELEAALGLLRSRHLVFVASVRERIVDEMMQRPMSNGDATLAVASAHLYEQARRDGFRRFAGRDSLIVDALPERLGAELVNRYNAVKRSARF